MIGPMRSPDIQNLLGEAFASIKREKSLKGLCKPKETRIYRPLQASREISNGVNHWSSNKSQTNFRPHHKPHRKEQDNESIDIRQPVV